MKNLARVQCGDKWRRLQITALKLKKESYIPEVWNVEA